MTENLETKYPTPIAGRRSRTTMSPKDRRRQIPALREEGLSVRAIGRLLGCDHQTILRDIRALCLPAGERAHIAAGAHVEPHLKADRQRRLEEAKRLRAEAEAVRERERIAEEARTQQSSKQTSQLIVAWLSRSGLDANNRYRVLLDAEHQLWLTGSSPEPARERTVMKAQLAKDRLAWPEKLNSIERINLALNRLLKWLPLLEPQAHIRDRALQSAKMILEPQTRL